MLIHGCGLLRRFYKRAAVYSKTDKEMVQGARQPLMLLLDG